MEITHQYAQNIVEMTMKVLNYNINIMDHMGIIVGSGDKKRIDSFHQGAAEVIKTGRTMDITDEQAQGLEGVKPGVNLPVYFNDKIVGVVGITGEPAEVRPFGELLKISVETMLQQVFLTEQLRMEQNAKELYIREIIGGNFTADEDVFLTKGFLLGFDMNVPRTAIIIKIYGIYEKTFGEIAIGALGNERNQKFGLNLQRRRESILNHIKTTFNNPQNMISYNGNGNFIIFYATPRISPQEIKPAIADAIANLRIKLEKYNISLLTGIGLYHPGISGLKKSYDEAIQVIYIGERLKLSGNAVENIVSAYDLGLEILLVNQTNNALQSYLEFFPQKKENCDGFFNQAKIWQTLKAFFNYDLNQSITAQKLDISRNTLSSRLDRVKELTGYDPRIFADAVKLKLFLLINELQSPPENKQP